MHPTAALIVLLAVLLLFTSLFLVGRARGRHGIKAPATTGHPGFERVFRAQMNTLEQVVLFLPTFAVAIAFGRIDIAAAFALLWLVGRFWYLFAYAADAGRRGLPFLISMIAWLLLLVQALWGLGWALVALLG